MISFKTLSLSILLLSLPLLYSCSQKPAEGKAAPEQSVSSDSHRVELVRKDAEKKVDVLIDGNYFTSYIYPETLAKPVLYPISTANGTLVTRGYPIKNRAGERIDHPHHVGLWLNYGDVNGLDFWNNSDAIADDKKDQYGSIIHKEIALMENGETEGKLAVTADWVDVQGNVLLKEETEYTFQGTDNGRIIDRTTRLIAQDKEVFFTDNKEGMLGMRMARELEQPSDKAEKFTDAHGVVTDVPTVNNEGVTGLYKGSNGMSGDKVWGSRGEWMSLAGEIEGEKITVAIIDHPDNVGYPTYWHARGYGLFAANPLGQKEMSGGKEELNFHLDVGESVTFKYRVAILSGPAANNDKVKSDFEEFAGK